MSTRYTAMRPTADDHGSGSGVGLRSGRKIPLKTLLIVVLAVLLIAMTVIAVTFIALYASRSSSSSESSSESTDTSPKPVPPVSPSTPPIPSTPISMSPSPAISTSPLPPISPSTPPIPSPPISMSTSPALSTSPLPPISPSTPPIPSPTLSTSPSPPISSSIPSPTLSTSPSPPISKSTSTLPTPSPAPPNVCQTEACFDLAVQILGAMDERADPCEDFYNFTCGNWDIFHHIRPGMAGYGALTIQQFDVYGKLADILEGNFTDGNKILLELQDFYDSCIAAQEMNITASLIPAIRKLYQDLGGWSLLNIKGDGTKWGINSTQFIREKRLGSPAFYDIGIETNENGTENIIAIEQSGLTVDYPFFYENSTATDQLVLLIVQFLEGLAQPGAHTENFTQAAMNIVQFETNLSQIWDDPFSSFDDDSNYSYTVGELYDLWPGHDWLTVFRGVFAPSGVDIKLSSVVYVYNADYFRQLNSLVQSTPNQTLENYAKWQQTWDLAEIFLPDSTIRQSIIDFKETVMGKPSLEEREECVEQAESVMPIALGRVYAAKILPKGYKEAGMKLVSQVREGLKDRMNEVDWLDSQTRKLSIEKLEAIESRVAYPNKTFDDDYLKELYGEYKFNETAYVENALQIINVTYQQQYALAYKPPDRTAWSIPPTTVNAYYDPEFNQITILEAIMRTPSFNTEWPLSMQYGALGMVLGHEMTHGFDNDGRRYDKNGRRRMWWTKKAVEAFKDRSECFVEQYSDYEMFGIQVDGNMTLGENIADNGGIRASYDAFKKVGDNSKALPGLTNYNSDQLFFIAFSQLWCSYTTQLSFETSVYTDVHSPDPIRVIGTLSNNEDFAEAFKCPAGSPMNPKKKCVLW